MNPQDAWAKAYHQLQIQLDRPTFDTWLRDLILLDASTPDVFVIGALNSYIRDMLEFRLYRTIRKAVSEAAEKTVELRFEVYTPPKANPDAPDDMPLFKLLAQQQAAQEAHAEREVSDDSLSKRVGRPQRPDLPQSELNPRYTFDRFIAGTENEMVYAAARSVVERPASAYNPFFIYGDVGLGKTHLLQSVAHDCIARKLRVIYIPSEVFTNDLVDAIRSRSTAMFRDKYRSVDVLIVDDIQFISGKETTQEEFFHTFNALYTFGKQIILASDRPPHELQTLEARLRSRFEGGLVMHMPPPSLETRIAILQMWAKERDVKFDSQVLEIAAGTKDRADGRAMNVRELEGIFNHMVASMHLTRQPLTAPDAADIVDNFRRPRHVVTISYVLEMTARQHGLTVDDLVGSRRDGAINHTRQVAMYLVREMTSTSLPQIGAAFGGRKHTTIMHGCHKVAEDMANNFVTRAVVEDLRARILKGE